MKTAIGPSAEEKRETPGQITKEMQRNRHRRSAGLEKEVLRSGGGQWQCGEGKQEQRASRHVVFADGGQVLYERALFYVVILTDFRQNSVVFRQNSVIFRYFSSKFC